MFNKDKKKKEELARKQGRTLIDCKGDVAFLQRMVSLVNNDPDLQVQLVLMDGTIVNVMRKTEGNSPSRQSFFED